MIALVKKVIGISALAFALALSTAAPAKANIVLDAPTVVFSAGSWLWTYTASLSVDETLSAAGAPVVGVTSTTGTGPSNLFDDYFTIYDVVGYVAGSAATTNASFTPGVQLLGPTAANVSPTDNNAVQNVFFYWTAADLVGPSGAGGLGSFSFRSTFGTINPFGEYSASDTNSGANPGATDNKISSLAVPMNPIPEPGSMLLLGTGLIGLARAARRRMAAK